MPGWANSPPPSPTSCETPSVDIFEPFITTKPQGTGLGLYICRSIIQSLHGQLGYRDGMHGTTFWFELPKAPAN